MTTDHEQQIADLQAQLAEAQAAAAAIGLALDCMETLGMDRWYIPPEAAAVLRAMDHAGAALLAELEEAKRERDLFRVNEPVLAELAAARAVITAARKCLAARRSNPAMHDRLAALSSAIHAYDATMTPGLGERYPK